MNASSSTRLADFMTGLVRRNPGEKEFHQAVYEVAQDILPFIDSRPAYRDNRILERMTEPDRIIIFRVSWEDDKGQIRANRGYRIQFNNSIGPYKGGLRFDRDLNLSILKFLGFEQTFKNSLTGLPLGGGKGGADFNPKGKSDHEIMRFCQSFMTELARHIGPDTDIPAGDIGVGSREISYMYGQYKRLTNTVTGTLTGKGLSYGGSMIRTEATGYGCVYMMDNILRQHGNGLEWKTALVSGSGNVAQFTMEKLIDSGVKVLTASDSSGFVYDKDGINKEKLEFIKDLKNRRRGRIAEYAYEYGVEYHEKKKPWNVPADLAFPCATQNEINLTDAKALVDNGCIAMAEGANMPVTKEGVELFDEAGILYAPAKAANAGGVAVSGLEMSQNSMRLSWSREEIDEKLKKIMKHIHDTCVEYGSENSRVNYRKGANIGGFIKVADAMIAFGNC
jgi:glutamate dehydrogenase/leucine dehydrogenase